MCESLRERERERERLRFESLRVREREREREGRLSERRVRDLVVKAF